jgi:hypothetical protein
MPKESINLFFAKATPPLLLKTQLVVYKSNGEVKETTSRWEQVAHPQETQFRWSKGVKTLCLALLRMKLAEFHANEEKVPLFLGRVGSAAATLDNLVHKADAMQWLHTMLRVEGEPGVSHRLQGWFERQNSQGNNKKRPIRVFAGSGAAALPVKNIKIWIAQVEATLEELQELESRISKELGESS